MKIGDVAICTSVSDFNSRHLTLGKRYKIYDIENRFPNTITIYADSGTMMMFDKDNFNGIQYLREEKINTLLE